MRTNARKEREKEREKKRVAVCWIVLQCVAVCCSMLQCVAVCCSVLQKRSARKSEKKENMHTREKYGVAMISRLLKINVSFAEYSPFYRALLQKRPIFLGSLLIVATSYTEREGAGKRSMSEVCTSVRVCV